MKKSHYRDYATEAFRFLARKGSAADYRSSLYNEMLRYQQLRGSNVQDGVSAPTEAAVMRAEQAVMDAAAELADLEAAEFALEVVARQRGTAVAKAVRAVYMILPDMELSRGEIEERVIAASMYLHADRRTIYRWLALARKVFAGKRGLRL